jgi:hypothetical protein
MGPRQKIFADLEYSAKSIREYNQVAIPGVLQSPEFLSALVELDRLGGPLDYEPERMAQARQRRQQELFRPDGPSYETILDECVIHRLGVPPAVMAVQLRHMINVLSSENKIAVRLLPHDAHIPGGTLPQSTFHHFTFPDPGDHPLVVLEAITTDVVLTRRRDVARYTSLHDRLRAASLPRDESLSFSTGWPNGLPKGQDRGHDHPLHTLAQVAPQQPLILLHRGRTRCRRHDRHPRHQATRPGHHPGLHASRVAAFLGYVRDLPMGK